MFLCLFEVSAELSFQVEENGTGNHPGLSAGQASGLRLKVEQQV